MGSLCFPKQPFSPSLNTMQQWGYQAHAMVPSESIPWLWIIFHSIKLRPVCSSFEGNTLFSVAIPRWLSTLFYGKHINSKTLSSFDCLTFLIWVTFFIYFIHFYLIDILNCTTTQALHPSSLSSRYFPVVFLSASIFRDNTIKSFQPCLPVFFFPFLFLPHLCKRCSG